MGGLRRLVVSLLVLLAEWNYLHGSWSRQKWDDLEYLVEAEARREWLHARTRNLIIPTRDPAALDPGTTPLDLWVKNQIERSQLNAHASEFINRMVFVPIPVLGGSIHVNDLGLAAGVILAVLSGLLSLLMAREHENLYLATFKIRQLRKRDSDHADGESPANLLYHALAMAQVLNDPPTLARWNQGSSRLISRAGIALVFLFPAIVQAAVVLQNIASREKAYAVWGNDVTIFRLSIQAGLGIAIIIFGLVSYGYTVACDERWRDAFFYVNPGLRYVEQEPWFEWMRVIRDPFNGRRERDLVRQLTYTLDVHIDPLDVSAQVPVATDVPVSADDEPEPISPWFRRLRFTHQTNKPPFVFTRARLRTAARHIVMVAEHPDAQEKQTERSRVVRELEISANTAVIRERKLVSWRVSGVAVRDDADILSPETSQRVL